MYHSGRVWSITVPSRPGMCLFGECQRIVLVAVAGKQDKNHQPHVLLLTQAPALSQKHPRTIRGGGGVRQLHEYCALAAHTLGQLKP